MIPSKPIMASAPENNEIADENTELDEDVATILEAVNTRHRHEREQFQLKIEEAKIAVQNKPESKRRHLIRTIARLTTQMERRHTNEIAAIVEEQLKHYVEKEENCHSVEQKQEPNILKDNMSLDEAITANKFPLPSITDYKNNSNNKMRISKGQRRANKNALAPCELKPNILAQLNDENLSLKILETRALVEKLNQLGLDIYETPTDGDCLYNAIRHQLMQAGIGNYSVAQLRDAASNYILGNKESFIHFMTDPQTGNPLSDEEFLYYCNEIRKPAAWGSQLELKALSSVLKVPIEVVQGEGVNVVQGLGEFTGPHLIITYHRYLYDLGEHYNSTVPLDEDEET